MMKSKLATGVEFYVEFFLQLVVTPVQVLTPNQIKDVFITLLNFSFERMLRLPTSDRELLQGRTQDMKCADRDGMEKIYIL